MAELKNRDRHESGFARKLSRLSNKHRRELERLLGRPPDIANVPAEFWERVEKETSEELMLTMLIMFSMSASQHGLDRGRAEDNARAYAAGRAADVASRYTQNSRDSLSTASSKWRVSTQEITDIDIRKATIPVFGPARIDGIATSETTKASTAGGEAGVGETVGFNEEDTWFTSNDRRVCPICEPLHRKKRSDWARFFPSGPPAHPRCRCWIHYAKEKRGAAVLTA